jgi:hypothetical protein
LGIRDPGGHPSAVFSYLTPPGHGAFEVFGFEFFPYAIAGGGWLGGNLFFILSGFVLFAPYHANLRHMATRKDAIAFYVNRARHFFPDVFHHSLVDWCRNLAQHCLPAGRTLIGLIVGLLALQLAAATWDSMRLGNSPYFFAPVTNNVVHVAFF